MSGLDSISVRVEGVGGRTLRTENLRPLLQQVEQALCDLRDSQQEATIDLSAMPFSEQDEADLRELLGSGEVSATLQAFGPTSVHETAVPGVWFVEHKDAEERRLTLHLEITRIPAILVTPLSDIADGVAAITTLAAPDAPADD